MFLQALTVTNIKKRIKNNILPVALTHGVWWSSESSALVSFLRQEINGSFNSWRLKMCRQPSSLHDFLPCLSHGRSVLLMQRSHFKPNLYLIPLKLGWVDWIRFIILSTSDNTIFAISVHSIVLAELPPWTEKKRKNKKSNATVISHVGCSVRLCAHGVVFVAFSFVF